MKIINRGAVLIEFTLIVPLLVIFSLGFFELYRLIAIHHYLETSAYKLCLWATKDQTTTAVNTGINIIINEGATYDMATKGTVIVTGLTTGKQTSNTINWFVKNGTANTQVTTAFPVLYNMTLFTCTINTIVVEVIYNYQPLFYTLSNKTLKYSICMDYPASNNTNGNGNGNGNGNNDDDDDDDD